MPDLSHWAVFVEAGIDAKASQISGWVLKVDTYPGPALDYNGGMKLNS